MKPVIQICVLICSAILALPQEHQHQEPHPDDEDPNYSFFAGSVEEFNDDEIVVRRTLSSRAPEVKHFIRNVETKVTGTLERGTRVVVAYTTEDGFDIAWRVLVRPPAKEHTP